MKLFKPQLQLRRRRNFRDQYLYHLHAVTFTDNTKYEAAGHKNPVIDEKGLPMIILYLKEKNDGMDFPYITPIVHTIDLGPLPIEKDIESLVRVCVVIKGKDAQTAGEGHTSTGDSDEDPK